MSINHLLDDNRVVLPYKIQKALNNGNLDGVRRLAKFVDCRSIYPDQLYDACEQQRIWYYHSRNK